MTGGGGLAASLAAPLSAAVARLAGRLRETPLLRSRHLEERFGFEIHLKLECLQETGSFKYRPALNAALAALESGRPSGFVTSSSGNFGIAAARASRVVGLPLDLVMMPSASGHKAALAESLGARVVRCADDYAAREEHVQELVAREGRHALHPHDGIETVAGDATVGLEIARQLPAAGSVIVPASGAGLVGGIAVALELEGRSAEIFAAQPTGNGSLARSLAAGRRVRTKRVVTLADGLSAAVPGELGFAIARERISEVALVDDPTIVAAVGLLARAERLMVEAAGAAPLAALLQGLRPPPPVVLVLSGANIAPRAWAELVGA